MLSKDKIREIFLANGFTVKEGQTDLKPYVYEAAEALLKEAVTTDNESRAMFVARLENKESYGDHDLTVAEVLALLNDCDMLANLN